MPFLTMELPFCTKLFIVLRISAAAGFFDDLNVEEEVLTDSSPALSAFHAMTGIPKNPAICKKYCDAAVDRPNFSVLVK